MIKYSDASNVEKTASEKVSSEKPLKECCKQKTAKQKNDCTFNCGCGNRIYKS